MAETYVAEPTSPGPWPGVVVIHEVFGLTDDIKAKADRFAQQGYLAVAPDLFAGQPKGICVLSAFRSLLAGKGRQFDVIDAERSRLAERPECTGSVGVIGFCMGGGFALLAGAKFPFAAASVNYGQVPPKDTAGVLRESCPVVASYGKRDVSLKGAAATLERALTENGTPHDVKEYPGASHSFLSEYTGKTAVVAKAARIGHHAPSADDAWRRIDAFFEEHVR
jgi:carboxymethylenebutenolidase